MSSSSDAEPDIVPMEAIRADLDNAIAYLTYAKANTHVVDEESPFQGMPNEFFDLLDSLFALPPFAQVVGDLETVVLLKDLTRKLSPDEEEEEDEKAAQPGGGEEQQEQQGPAGIDNEEEEEAGGEEERDEEEEAPRAGSAEKLEEEAALGGRGPEGGVAGPVKSKAEKRRGKKEKKKAKKKQRTGEAMG